MLRLGEAQTKPHAPPCLWGGCLPGNSRSAYLHAFDIALSSSKTRSLQGKGKQVPHLQMTSSHTPAPACWRQAAHSQTPRTCAGVTLAPPNPSDSRGSCRRGEAGCEARGRGQSCLSSCSKLTRGRRGLLGGASPRRRESVVGRASSAPRWTVPAAAGACGGDSGRSPGGESGARNRRGRGGAWPGSPSPPLQPQRAHAKPSAPLLASSPCSASCERRAGLWGDGIPWRLTRSLNPHTFHSSPL